MNVHKNARLTPRGREWIVTLSASGQTPKAIASAVGVCPRTVRKWLKRHQDEGLGGLKDRSSRPHRLHRPTPREIVERIEALRRQRLTGKAIAVELRVSRATVSRVLKRLGLNKLSALSPAEPVKRYERKNPGELIHIDIKKLGRFNRIGHRITGDRARQTCKSCGAGWEFVHVCIDDASRIAFSQIMPNEKKQSAVSFLKAALAYYDKLGVKVERVMTDNGSCYRSFAFRQNLQAASASGTSAPGPTRPRPTARPSASSRPACANGLTPVPTKLQINVPTSCRDGFTAITGIARMAVLRTSRRSANLAWPGITY